MKSPNKGAFARQIRHLAIPLRTKVRLVVLSVGIVALMTVVGAVFVFQLHSFRTSFANTLMTLGSIMASNCSAALDFGDPKAANETLAALDAKPEILGATITTSDGRFFARFGNAETPEALKEFSEGTRESADGRHWLHGQPVIRDGKQLGMLYLRANYAVRRDELIRAAFGIIAGVLGVSIFLVLALTARLQGFITRPIAQLAEAAREVARRNDYSVRVTKDVDDELGQLTDAFNQMLGEIQRQDSALQAARETLELQVEALAVSEARFRGVVENLGEALLLVSLNGETIFINPRFSTLLGWTQEDLQNRDALKMLMPDTARYGLLLGRDASDAARPALEVQLRRKDETLVWTEIHASPMRGADGELIGTLAAILDITVRRAAAEELEELNKRLLETSHAAGMAQVATGVLHNVGNVLNSVNLSASLALEKLRQSKIPNLGKAAALLKSANGKVGDWLDNDPQGQRLPGYIEKLAEHLTKENREVTEELDHLARNVEHIKEIVSVQQSYARVRGLMELLSPERFVEDALRMHTAKFARHGIAIERDYLPTPNVKVDKHKVLQILVNLVRNAKHSLEEVKHGQKRMVVGIRADESGFVKITVADNGIGIPAQNLTRIFQHGFTTKKDGHGFGLHSGALAAREMGGSLTVESGGPDAGAIFTLSLPVVFESSMTPTVSP